MDQALLDQVHRARLSDKTWQARQSDLRQYGYWCQAQGIDPARATDADLCLWMTHMACDGRPNRLVYQPRTRQSSLVSGPPLSVRSIRRRLSTLKWWMAQQGRQPNPASSTLVQDHLSGIVRLLPSRPKRAKGLGSDPMADLMASMEEREFIDLRDKTLLAVGFAGALRVSDLASLKVEDIRLYPNGANLGFETRKRRSEFSQVPIVAGSDPQRCPVALLRRYLAYLSDHSGPLFRRANRNRQPLCKPLHPTSVARIIMKRAQEIGLASSHGGISGHSLRRGFIDSALLKGAPISEVMKISGHRDPKTLMLYLDDLGHFEQHPGQGLY
ncbi:tyrosine-type recombinase/integrase [Ferrimonas balearica]|uniref:tyrosine-type recombinase/integrase n=1 Tax=Ferrimonas balearica TaxID=44012 RepID=UPI001C99BE96|nr:tyrosine-type recombinase/integrase [Ferrimonas balearica]MBY5920429.1 tyrosine-type recombinase/integrase [Ferrimonas balearica]MBY5996886.1 tyrosine-type recombinase/integrase [Ferrimonas balearica]